MNHSLLWPPRPRMNAARSGSAAEVQWPALWPPSLRDVKEACEVDAQHSRVISLGILSERLGDEYAGVVDERVDAPEPGQAFGNRTLGRLPVGNVAGQHQDLVIVGWPDRPCRRDHPVIAIAICFDKGRAHALRGASDDGNLPFAAHARLLHPSRSMGPQLPSWPTWYPCRFSARTCDWQKRLRTIAI